MARKRDYKAEYAAAKRRANAAGYKSEREYKAVRKALHLPPKTSPVPRRIVARIDPNITASATSTRALRREAKKWSDAHSHNPNSKYKESLTDDQVRRYHAAYVEKIPGKGKTRARAKLSRIHDYLVPDVMSESEWEQDYTWK